MRAPNLDVDALAKALGLRPCPDSRMGNARSWYACWGGDSEPTVGYTCSDDQCENPAHDGRRPCTNAWHRRKAVLGPLVSLIEDLAAHGLRADLQPTMLFANMDQLYAQFSEYLRKLDCAIRERAAAALNAEPAR